LRINIYNKYNKPPKKHNGTPNSKKTLQYLIGLTRFFYSFFNNPHKTGNKAQIIELLRDEIIKRYQYKEGLYQYYTKNNAEIKRATQLLNNIAEYNKIIKK
jgi:hypothetical protein